ncbi:MAG: VIT1/CCC1 family predicted Fe2+/Mn2+ transporter [Oceanicoccus sp.]|jgi:VIT1/CCC1 family predicted Fe2+/Mn2+ transporter
MKKNTYNWLPDFVYGGIDGAVTTFAVVMGVVGADLSTAVILILGFANLFADGLSMAVGKYSSDKAELEQIKLIKKQERQAIIDTPDEEKKEVRDILREFGFSGKDLKSAEKIITSDPDTWVHMMLHHEFHIIEENIQPKKGAVVTFLAFVSIGLIPLLAYMVQPVFKFTDGESFTVTILATLVALFIVGTVKTRFTERHWVLAGLETAGIGGLAALVAYVVGAGIHNLIA